MIEFAITADPDIHYINVSEFNPLNHYEWELDEKGVYMSIGDLESQEKPGPLIIYSQLFRYDDPTEYFRGPTSFGAKLFVMKNKLCFYCRKYFNSLFRRSDL